jgi:hypothetical protein
MFRMLPILILAGVLLIGPETVQILGATSAQAATNLNSSRSNIYRKQKTKTGSGAAGIAVSDEGVPADKPKKKSTK